MDGNGVAVFLTRVLLLNVTWKSERTYFSESDDVSDIIDKNVLAAMAHISRVTMLMNGSLCQQQRCAGA